MKLEHKELLAPAGDLSSLHAAVTAGADAVYLGLDAFNARRGAANFTLETLEEACDYAHVRGVKIYLTLNIAVLPSEVSDALELARQAFRRGVDAFIVQDVGLAEELRRVIPEAELHLSTQMNIHSKAGLEIAVRLGAERVTLARELSLTELKGLGAQAEELGIELEVFAHGALCVCYSGQCFMSSMIGGRSANRGLCAQACRLPYTLHNKALRKTLPAQGEHLLSPKDLCAVDLIPHLLDAGVTAFKIEGRMKSPAYVYTVVSVYRHALDKAIGGNNEPISDDEKQALAEVFSRGFTTAYLEGQRGNEIMGYGRPNNRGAFIGRVASVAGSSVALTHEKDIAVGDILEFWTSKGHFTHPVDELRYDREGNLILHVERGVGKGDRVFRVRSAQIAFVDNPQEPRILVSGSAVLKLGQPLRLSFTVLDKDTVLQFKRGQTTELSLSDAAPSVELEGSIIEAARTKAVNVDEVDEHIDRLGNTPFALAKLDIELDEGVGVGFSQLHRARSQALEKLQEIILEPYKQRSLVKVAAQPKLAAVSKKDCAVAAWATNPACARAAKRAGAELIYVPALFYKRGQAVIAGQLSETAEQAGYPKQSIVALPVVDHDVVEGSREYAQEFDAWQYAKPQKPVLVENLAQMLKAVDEGALPEIGSHVPVLNSLTLQVVSAWGAKRVWLSPELSLGQIEELGNSTPVPLGVTIMGNHELMTTEHCMLMSQGSCDEDCFTCQRRKSPHYLKDRKGYEFPVITDCCGRSHLYNAVEFDVAHAAPDLIRAGVSAFMVDTSLMNVAETTKAVQRAVRARDIALKSGDKVSKKEGATTGHLFRGVS